MKWTDKVAARLTEREALVPCLACGCQDLHIEQSPLAICNGAVAVALIACKGCGLTRTHALELLGIEDA